MSSTESCKTVLNHLIEGERGQHKALEIFLQASTDVQKALQRLFFLEYAQRRVSQDAMLNFVESLPQVEWVIFACDLMLQESGRWNKLAVALVLCKAMARTTGKTLMIAEICWIQRLSFEARAIASSAPVTITSAIGGDALYVAGDGYSYNDKYRSVFCWKGQWTPDNKKELWRFIPAPTGSSDYYLVNVYAEEYLFASSVPATSDDDGYSMKRVLVRGKDLPDLTRVWRLVELESDNYTFYNASHDAFLSSPVEAPDGSRREVVTSNFHPLDEKRLKCREWKITSTAPSRMEMGLVEFLATKYDKAVKVFTNILTMNETSAADCTKLLFYRMVANLMLKNVGFFKQDLAHVMVLGGYPDYFFDVLAEKLPYEDWQILKQRKLEVDSLRG